VDLITLSIPFFLVLLGTELAYSAATGRRLLRLNDSIADLGCGIVSQLSGLFTKGLTLAGYIWVERTHRIQRYVPEIREWTAAGPFESFATLWQWAWAFLLVDLAYYWMHRWSHEVNLLWGGHVVHHSSEEYNLAVALRQSALHGLLTWVFYLPLAAIGIPWRMFVACYALNLIYQFWIHTRAVGRLPAWLEWVLNTPSHHRVHHGVDPEYQDRNYAGVFIIWDRLFGTFTPERQEPTYGITHPLRSWNPLWANLHVWVEIAGRVSRARDWRERWMYLFGPPGWRPERDGGRERPVPVARATQVVFDPAVPAGIARYGLAQFLVVLVGSVELLRRAETLPLAQAAPLAALVVITLGNLGGLFERERWAHTLELARHLTLGVTAALLLVSRQGPPWFAAALFAVAAGSLLWLARLRPEFTRLGAADPPAPADPAPPVAA
jgi:sterol desaturase/sphingolipid hydroxylase (fatty acid hydroxylase superfamily)